MLCVCVGECFISCPLLIPFCGDSTLRSVSFCHSFTLSSGTSGTNQSLGPEALERSYPVFVLLGYLVGLLQCPPLPWEFPGSLWASPQALLRFQLWSLLGPLS